MSVKKIIERGVEYSNKIPAAGESILGEIEARVVRTEATLNSYVSPARETVIKRYPTLFTIVATVGVIATFLGLEQILLGFSILNEYPTLLFFGGVGILALTGQLYKKL